ncbi:MarR family winged helix-turn-helix transcriptional regulator [Dactylosporangium darangshiense]|uniref:MarR family winged helix-turn-helix transcriptional regulator n=1 Tax=Dactylosporangium darangshiense TaxID=579108 RepID=UPI003626C7F1
MAVRTPSGGFSLHQSWKANRRGPRSSPGNGRRAVTDSCHGARRSIGTDISKKNALTPHALDWNEFLVLRVVAVEPGIRSSRAASRLGMNRATLSGVVSRLEDRDLIRRESVDDGVRVELNLTQTGIEVWRGVSRDAAEAERSFTRAPAGQRTLVALARRIGGLVGPV